MAISTTPVIQQQINAAFALRFTLNAAQGARCHGTMEGYAHLGPVQMATLSFSAHRTRPSQGKRRGDSSVLISALTRGACEVRQRGNRDEATAGDIFLLDIDQGFQLDTTDMETRALLVQTSFLQRHFPEYGAFGGRVVRGDSDLGRLALGILDQTFAPARRSDALAARRFADSFLQFLGAALMSQRSPDDGASLQLMSLQEHLRDTLADPSLDVAAMARFLRLGERQIHNLFAQRGTTPMRWLKRERLVMIARDLRNPLLSGRSVSAIAFDWGFSDAGHFSRSFRREFGVSPLTWRRKIDS